MMKGTAAHRALRRRAAEVDRLREEVGHYKLWEGAAMAISSALAGWLVSAGESAPPLTFSVAITGVVLLGIGRILMYRQIARHIERIGKS